jgi:hypothetical protein
MISARVLIVSVGIVVPGGSPLPGVVPVFTSARFAALSPALERPVAFVVGAPMGPPKDPLSMNRCRAQIPAIEVISFIATLLGSVLQGPRNARIRIGPFPKFERAIAYTSIFAGLQLIAVMFQFPLESVFALPASGPS